jgi:hypothetical protein
MAPAPSLARGSQHHEQRGLHRTIETLLNDCDSNFMPVALFPHRSHRFAKIWLCNKNLCTRTKTRSVKNNSSVRRNEAKLRGVPVAEHA